MIPFNAASAGAYWERLLVLLLEQPRAVDRERPSEQRSEEQPGYSGESRPPLLHHQVRITAIQSTVMGVTDIPLTHLMDIHRTHRRDMDTQATRVLPITSVLPAMGTKAIWDTPPTPLPRAMNMEATRATWLTPIPRAMDRRATYHTLLTAVRRAPVIRPARRLLPSLAPVTDIPHMATPAIAFLGTGRPEPSRLSSRLAEFRAYFSLAAEKSSPSLALTVEG